MRRLFLILLVVCCLAVNAQAASAPYTTLTENNAGRLVNTLGGYVPDGVFNSFDGKTLKGAKDLFVYGDQLFIADTGNKRVVCCTLDGELIRIYGAKDLKKPNGICVRNGKLYVADQSKKAVVVFDLESAKVVQTYEKPTEPLYGEKVRFEPLKVQVDSAGTLYVICNGNSGGVAMISEDGTFLGYFGANNTPLGLGDIIKRFFYTADMMSSVRKNIPNTPNSLAMDARGLLYTATTGAGPESIKKFSMAGENLLQPMERLDDQIVDVAVGPLGTFFAINSLGYIYEFTEEGRLVFFFGGEDRQGNRDALFKQLAAIDVDAEGKLYVLDTTKNMVQRFSTTQYANRLHNALVLWQEGLYAESLGPWQEVLRSNSLFDFTYTGLGKAYYKLEKYDLAMENFRLGGDKEGYSDAYWEVRAVTIQNGFAVAVGALILLCVFVSLFKRLKIFGGIRKGMARIGQLRPFRVYKQIKRVIANPASVFYDLKYDKELVTNKTALILYFILFLMYEVNRYASAFLFKTVPDGEFNIAGDFFLIFGILILFLTSLNLVCSTRQSEAKAQHLFRGLPFAFAPYLLLQPILFVIGYFLTYNEQFLMTFGNFLMIGGSIVLIFVMVREMQNYSYGETIRVILLTLFVMLVMALTLVVLVILITHLYEFFTGLIREVSYSVF